MTVAVVVVTAVLVTLELVVMGPVLELAVSAADLELVDAALEAVALKLASFPSLTRQYEPTFHGLQSKPTEGFHL